MARGVKTTKPLPALKVPPSPPARTRRPMPSPSATAQYRGANGGRLSTLWPVTSLDPQFRYSTEFDRRRMLDRARNLQRNNALAAGILQRMTENVVADGFKHQATTASKAWNKKADALFARWTAVASAEGLTWTELQRLVQMSSFRDGDIAIVLLDDGTLQLVEGDLILTPAGKYNKCVDGVQLDDHGRPAAFYFQTVGLDGKIAYTSVPAEDVILYCHRDRAGQVRGVSAFASSFPLFDQIDSWTEATVVAARAAACYSIAITRADAGAVVAGYYAQAQAEQAALAAAQAAAGSTAPPPRVPPPEVSVAPGMVSYLEPGEDIKALSPTQPNNNFSDSLRSMVRMLGSPVGLPLELITLDFSQAGGPTARAAMLQVYRTFRTVQKLYTECVLTRIYRWRISKFIKAGLLPYRDDALSHRWIAPQFPLLDPNKEIQAQMLAVDLGTETITSLLQKNGHDLHTWIVQRKNELDLMKAAGIPVVHQATAQPYQPALTPDDDEEQDGGDDDTNEADDAEEGDEDQND